MLQVYNTLKRQKEEFIPLHPPFVGMYVCGPTVYDDPHLGHAKSYVFFDVAARFLRTSGFRVRYVQNITDVGHLLGDGDEGEDRILKKARLEKLEPVEIAQKYERHYFRDMDRLNCLRPDISSRATGHVPEMIELVKILIGKGFAYESEGNIYFDVSKFEGYGKLSGRKIEELKEGARVKPAEGKRHFSDFALWKKADPVHLMQWQSPWGMGFPGWHLECSVMAMKYLGESIDIHGGGLDNQFPHHECEIAQSEGATGKPFVKYWIHNNMVTVEGQKMSKSLGNFITLNDLFQKYDPMTVRFFVLQGHYRSPQDFSDQALNAAQKGFERLSAVVNSLKVKVEKRQKPEKVHSLWETYRNQFLEHMENDFNTPGAVSILFEMANQVSVLMNEETAEELQSAKNLFSLLGETILGLRFEDQRQTGQADGTENQLMDLLIRLRREFRGEKAWERADEIRQGLKEIGIVLEDGTEGTSWKKID